MCDAKTLTFGLLGGRSQSVPAAPKLPDPAAERAKAEAAAAQSANAQLAADQRRRREQSSLIARGAPAPTFGDTGAAGLSPISGSTSRSTTAKAGSLMGRGAPTVYGGGGLT